MELRQYVTTVWKWSWLIVLSTIVAAFFSWLAVKDQPAYYQTATTLMIGQAIEQVDPTTADFYTSEQLARTYSELIKRELVLRPTAQELGFGDHWYHFKEQVSVNLIPGTQLMEIQVIDTEPKRAKLIADGVARQLIAIVEQSKPQGSSRKFIEEQAASLPPKIEAAQREIQKLEAELAEAYSARQIQDIQSRISTLEQQITDWQATFAQYQLLLGQGSVNVLTVIEEAPLPTTPIGPNWITQVLVAAAIGLILPTGAAFLLEYLDDSLKSSDDIEKVTGLTVLGTVGRIPGNTRTERIITAWHPKSPISEAYRVLRTNLQFASPDRPLRSLLVTSPSPVEGKSTTAANLGVVMAQSGKSVVLVDSDLRHPLLHQFFQMPNSGGLTNALLQDEPSLDGWLQETGIENLRVLTSGPLPPKPSELLGSQKMRSIIEQLGEEADIAIFDTPPILLVTDAAVLATQVDGVLLVAQGGQTRRAAARQAVENLQQVGGNLLGAVLNRARGEQGGYYYYYGEKRNRRGRLRRWLSRLPGRSPSKIDDSSPDTADAADATEVDTR